jgi:hypothetical protein
VLGRRRRWWLRGLIPEHSYQCPDENPKNNKRGFSHESATEKPVAKKCRMSIPVLLESCQTNSNFL